MNKLKKTLKRKIKDEVEIEAKEELSSEEEASTSSRTPKRAKTSTKLTKNAKSNSQEEEEASTSSQAPKRAKTSTKPTKKSKTTSQEEPTKLEPLWTTCELLAEQQDLNVNISDTIINLLEEGNTIPFIARYRRDVTNNLSPERLREIKETFEEICTLKSKITKTLKTLEKSKVLDDHLKMSIVSSRSVEELEYVYAPYKPGGKRTLAERAKELGLEEPALQILNNSNIVVNVSDYINKEKKELSSDRDVEKGIIHILASAISTNTEVLHFMRELRKTVNFLIKTKKVIMKENPKSDKDKDPKNKVDDSKFDNYNDFEIPLKFIKPHQVLAINRGENLKILSVKIVVPDKISHDFSYFCHKKWISLGKNPTRQKILEQAIQDSYTRLVQPLMIREIRAEMKLKAERASCEVFSTNLKHLLLAPPLKGKPILGIDPGFSNGCKLALVSPMGQVLGTDVIHPFTKSRANQKPEKDVSVIKNLLQKYNCELVAVGNGTGCRQTEEWLSNLINSGEFYPLNVQYTIVSEDGASIYSCSPEAKKEFPELDPNIISAVSLARRIQEPLAELVKVEPKHLGVGMYQHDLKKKQLEEALKEVVSECVSFVGVDLNTTSQCLLKHVAGLSDKKATQIVQFREENGPFVCRKQLLEVSGIGNKIFQQCAGFLRVTPISVKDSATFYRNKKTTKLDATYIHPESYDVGEKLMKKFGLNSANIGERDFINTIKTKFMTSDLGELSTEMGSTVETVKLILDTLSKPLSHDLRTESTSQTPLFKKGVTNVSDISPGSVLTGRITNVTHFGCFVDIGVGRNGLIHCSKYNGFNLQLGDKVEVKVLIIDTDKNRISLQALNKF